MLAAVRTDVPPVNAVLAERLYEPLPESSPENVCDVPVVLNDINLVFPVAPLSITIGRLKLNPLPVNRGWNVSLAPSAPVFLNVSVPALPAMLLLLKFRSTVVAVEVVSTRVSVVILIGFATGAVVAE